jgi:2-keto-4-pentenoate hydratase/2-oxohepta-3-ene-1,7-dioic acid hydratase in catechol pathway
MVTADEIPDPSELSFVLKVNDEVRQQDSLSRLVLGVPELIEHAASIMTLHPADVIFSGTPPRSVGPVKPGDVMHAQMDRIGEMSVQVRGGPGRKTPE